MTQQELNADRGKIIGLQERRLGRIVLRTYRAKADIDDIVPNPQQPRLGPKDDDELQRQIEANEGLFEPWHLADIRGIATFCPLLE
jgi:ParB family chromosome partitioning protein